MFPWEYVSILGLVVLPFCDMINATRLKQHTKNARVYEDKDAQGYIMSKKVRTSLKYFLYSRLIQKNFFGRVKTKDFYVLKQLKDIYYILKFAIFQLCYQVNFKNF